MGCGHSNNSFTQAKNAEEIIALISNVKEPYDTKKERRGIKGKS